MVKQELKGRFGIEHFYYTYGLLNALALVACEGLTSVILLDVGEREGFSVFDHAVLVICS